jgi:WXG100 family type VII secretion target
MAAAQFGQAADLLHRSLAEIRRQVQTLQSGDWVGEGASAFYAEMNDRVLPAVQRLADALGAATTTTGQVSQVMKAAEDEAARYLRGNGSGAAAGVGATASAFVPAGGAAAMMPGPTGTAVISDDETAGWTDWATERQKRREQERQKWGKVITWDLMTPEEQQAERAKLQAESVKREIARQAAAEHARRKAAEQARRKKPAPTLAKFDDPFPHLPEAEKKRALAALDAYQKFLRYRPGYDAVYGAIIRLTAAARLDVDEDHHLRLKFVDPAAEERYVKGTFGGLAEKVMDAALDTAVGEATEGAVEEAFGELWKNRLVAFDFVVNAFDVLRNEKQEHMVNARGLEADEWREQRKLSLVLDGLAQASGRNKADLLDQYRKFARISNEYSHYVDMEKKLANPAIKDPFPPRAWPAP